MCLTCASVVRPSISNAPPLPGCLTSFLKFCLLNMFLEIWQTIVVRLVLQRFVMSPTLMVTKVYHTYITVSRVFEKNFVFLRNHEGYWDFGRQPILKPFAYANGLRWLEFVTPNICKVSNKFYVLVPIQLSFNFHKFLFSFVQN